MMICLPSPRGERRAGGFGHHLRPAAHRHIEPGQPGERGPGDADGLGGAGAELRHQREAGAFNGV